MTAVQIINQEKEFKESEFERLLNYSFVDNNFVPTVSVLGPQSSGKSTLLNGLFSTKFDVMDDKNRSQTTHGIWASKDSTNKILILDVEGTDGHERGEDLDFERKSALFSLSVSQILIINVWESSVGLYHAANMNLLRTILDVYFQIISSAHKITLMFVIRDYVGRTPKDNLSSIIKNDLQNIWNSLKKPEKYHKCEFEDFFTLKFFFLPHKILQEELFKSSINEIRNYFLNSESENYIFDEDFSNLPRISDLPLYSKNIWKKIIENNDLDLPTERNMLAQYRCDEAISEIVTQFEDDISNFSKLVNEGDFCEELCSEIIPLLNSANEIFLSSTNKFDSEIVGMKQRQLMKQLEERIYPLVSKSEQNFSENLFENLAVEFKKLDDILLYSESSNLLISKYKGLYKRYINSCSFPDFTFQEDFLDSFKRKFEKLIRRISYDFCSRQLQLEKLVIEEILKKSTLVSFGIENYKKFWDSFFDLIKESFNKLESFLKLCEMEIKLNTLDLENLNIESYKWLNNAVSNLFVENFNPLNICNRITFVFEQKFFYDNHGLPRVYSDEYQVDKSYECSHKATFEFLEIISKIHCTSWNVISNKNFILPFKQSDPEIHSVLSPSVIESIKVDSSKQMEKSFKESKRNIINQQTKIPPWIYLVIFILGWNEMKFILKSPFYLTLTVFLCVLIAIIKHLNLMPWINHFIARLMSSGVSPNTERLKAD